ncbi:MAG: choice-of-anchor Q domain-containing protein [Aquihabitans sp.]
MTRRRTVLATLTAAAVLLLGATGCEPPPPVPTFQVDNFGPGADTAPGDGVCEAAAPGSGCSLQAAVDEANAHSQAIVVAPGDDNTAYAPITATITGKVTMRAQGTSEGNSLSIPAATLEVAVGGVLNIEGVDVESGTLRVDGLFVGHRIAVRAFDVGASGQVFVTNGVLLPTGETPALMNAGHVWLRFTTVALFSGAGGLATVGAGETNIGATAILASNPLATTCHGTPPISAGYNAVTNNGCSLTGVGDIQNAPLGTLPYPPAGSPQIDAIESGVLGCGTTVTTDGRGFPATRPVDSSGIGDARCDIGAYEVQPA